MQGSKELEKCIRSEATKLSCVPRLGIVERKEEEKFWNCKREEEDSVQYQEDYLLEGKLIASMLKLK